MESLSLSLPERLYRLVQRHALLSGRSWEEEFVHGVSMYFDPEYAAQEMERVVIQLRGQSDVLYEEESDETDGENASGNESSCSS